MKLPSTDLDVSPVFLGTADICSLSDSELDALIGAYRDAGGRVLDTAHVYAAWTVAGDGCSERAVARSLERLDAADLIVATKGGHPALEGYRSCRDWLSTHRLRADAEDSLGRLRRETIDLYYLHRDDTTLPVGEIVETANELVRAGMVRYLGASNWRADRIAEANRYAQEHGLAPFVIAQSKFSLAFEKPADPLPRGEQIAIVQEEDRTFHETHGLPLAAFAATGGGYFESAKKPRSGIDNATSQVRRDRVQKLAVARGVAPTQIALAWLMHQPFPCFPITGTTNTKHVHSNCSAAELSLTEEEVAWLGGAA